MNKTSPAHETKAQRQARRQQQRVASHRQEEQNRQKARGGGQPNELGVTQGQNGEQGNTTEPRQAQPVAHPLEH